MCLNELQHLWSAFEQKLSMHSQQKHTISRLMIKYMYLRSIRKIPRLHNPGKLAKCNDFWMGAEYSTEQSLLLPITSFILVSLYQARHQTLAHRCPTPYNNYIYGSIFLLTHYHTSSSLASQNSLS